MRSMQLLLLLPCLLLPFACESEQPVTSSLQSIQDPFCRQELVGDCSWYERCLEAQYPCGKDAYALGYGQKYCERFTKQKWVSSRTSLWVAKTRNCLQNNIIESLDTNSEASCSEIYTLAFDSHPDCYTGGKESFCFLNPVDITSIYLTLDNRDRWSKDSTKQMQTVIRQCLSIYMAGKSFDAPWRDREGMTLEEREEFMRNLLLKVELRL